MATGIGYFLASGDSLLTPWLRVFMEPRIFQGAAMTSKLLLNAQNLQKQFGAVVAAQDICVDIRSGERVSLIGSKIGRAHV